MFRTDNSTMAPWVTLVGRQHKFLTTAKYILFGILLFHYFYMFLILHGYLILQNFRTYALFFLNNDALLHTDIFFTEALGKNAGPSTSPPASERKLFSDVTRLGFASAQDSPPLRAETGDTAGKNESTRDQGMPYHIRYSTCTIL
jgi:hypothetical protein